MGPGRKGNAARQCANAAFIDVTNLVLLSPQYLSSAGEDKTVRMWKVEDWQVGVVVLVIAAR